MPKKRSQDSPDDPVVLRFAGRGPYRGAPARDLRQSDLARLAYRHEVARTGPDGVRPSLIPDPDVVEQIVAELTGSGLYTQEG